MADDAKPDENSPEAKAAEAAKAVAEHTDNVEANANAAIEAAKAQADAAKEESERIAQAALQTALGQQFESYKAENETWRTQQAQTIQQQTEKISALEKTANDLAAGVGMLLGALRPANPSPSTLSKSDATAEADKPKPPAANPGEGADGHAPAPAPKARTPGKRLL